MIVAVQDQFHAMPLQHRQQALGIRQALKAAVMVGAQRMMDQQHAKGMRFGKLRQQAIERVELPRAELPGGHQGCGRHRGGEADQRQRPAAAQEGKRDVVGRQRVVAMQVIGKFLSEQMLRISHIGVVVAGNDRDLIRRPDTLQPRARRHEFRRKREIHEIAGDGDVIRLLRLHIVDKEIKHLAPVDGMPIAFPVQIAECALARELP